MHLLQNWGCSLSPLKKYLASKSPTIAFCLRHVLYGCYHNIEERFNFPGSLHFYWNFITVIVFWIHRYKLKRTSFLLIYLAVADLLAGVTQATMAAQPVPQTISADISACFQAAFLAASVLFLVFISLERAYALIYPLRHRVTSTNAYIYTIIIVWLIAITWGTSFLLVVYDIFEFKFYMAAFSFAILFCLVIICLSYVVIQAKLSQERPAIDPANNRHKAFQHFLYFHKRVFGSMGPGTCILLYLLFFCRGIQWLWTTSPLFYIKLILSWIRSFIV